MNDKKGFTLLELIIVIVIVGVLAGIAFPQFFRVVENSRVAEARIAVGAIRQGIERCYLMNSGSYATCSTFPVLSLEDPGTTPNSHFTYAISGTVISAFTVTSTRNTRDGGSSANTLSLTCNPNCAWSGTGAYTGFQ